MSPKTVINPQHHPDPDNHPSEIRLVAYHRGQLRGPEEEEIQEHFLRCATCRQTMLAIADFLDGTIEAPRWNPDDLVAAWRSFEDGLKQDTEEPTPSRR